jgi:hypothetical protein
VFAIVSLALLMASVDQTIVATALPALQHDLHAQVNWSSWTITIYALGADPGQAIGGGAFMPSATGIVAHIRPEPGPRGGPVLRSG